MCSIILRIGPDGVCIAANRDERVDRPWDAPAQFWPGITGGRDRLAGGTWMGLNRHGVMAAVLNRTGTLGPAPGKNSRGELPLLALQHATAAAAAQALAALDAGSYRSFNLVVADASGAFLACGLAAGPVQVSPLPAGVTMITSGAPNDVSMPRIARHLPKFQAADFADWGALLADGAEGGAAALNIPPRNGFGTVCASLITLPQGGPPEWYFAPASRGPFNFSPLSL
jgi:uncharacterized protein with NRDE domain